ncbi:MAG: class I SAM-dependent methyltransferase [Chloroflexi bacterium]|nr:class I SAM-dependent methyltransferase [Chloroflexota bacterium]
MDEFRSHRRFAAIWDWATKHESKAERALRRAAAESASGRILELGIGVGANWAYLAPGADYTGIEPDKFMLQRAQARAKKLGREMKVQEARAESLPFDDAQFDTVLVTLTFCTVQDPAKAISEAARVLKPGGQLVFVEHVRPDGKVGGWVMDRITPVWRRAAAGCHPNRLTGATIAAGGFEIESMQRRRVNGLPMIAGIARKPRG